MHKEIKTPFGIILPQVSLFPILYLIFIYGFVYILPYGRDLIGISWFDWLRREDGPLEWIQFMHQENKTPSLPDWDQLNLKFFWIETACWSSGMLR